MTDWISVEDRLPEIRTEYSESDFVLAYKGGLPFVATYDGTWYNFPEGECIHNVTHWMPIPKTPDPN